MLASITALALIIVYHMSGQRISTWLLNLHRAKVLLRDSWPLLISALTAVLYLRMDVIMLGEMHSEAAVGIYGAATRISEAWYFIPTALVASLQPSIMQAKAHSEELFQARLRNVYNLMSALSISVAMVVTLFADKLVWLLFGQSYEAAGTVLVVHVWAAVAVSLGVASSQYLVVENLQKISMYRTTVGLLCNLGLNVFLIPRYGAWGAAVATLISYSVSTLSMGIFMQGRQQTVMMLRSLNPLEWRSLSFR
jgi:O-antigen/teichoic acid export membrane protein